MRQIKIITLVTIGLLLSSCKDSLESDISRPNIILMVADDHGLDALGCYGNSVVETPNLDLLAAEGVRFSNAYCTSASCAASRAAILTGRYGHATGAYGHTHDYHHFSTYDLVKSLPVMLSQKGYLTARIGKYHLAPETVYHFDKTLEADARNSVEMAAATEEILNSDQPFFLYFCTDDPHRGSPFTPERWDMPNRFGNRDEGYDGVTPKIYSPDDVLVPSFLPDTKQTREELAEYYQSVSRIDQGVGRLMKMLKESGKEENTIVIYISDNGIAFPGAKTTTYEPGIKLPCIIRDPSVESKNIVNNGFISWVDLTPTILDMAGVDFSKDQFHGKSFKSILGEENPKGWDSVFASHIFHEITMYYPMRTYRKGDLKLIWNPAYRLEYPFASDLWASSTWQGIIRNDAECFGPRTVQNYLFHDQFELYDLSKDPNEVDNLAYKEEYKETLELMTKELKSFQKRTSDPWMILWDNDASLQGTGVGL